jgi:nanoRNase/pAp phosphatase (c-di-AMP/oligoRNAs hydrolase)
MLSYLRPNQTDTLIIAKKLLDLSQTELQTFSAKFNVIPKTTFEIVRELMKNTQYATWENWPGFQYSHLDREYIEKGGFTDIEVSEAKHIYMTHYLRMVEGYPWGFVVVPKQNGDCNISFRALPDTVNVRLVSEKMNLGGGHDLASGGTFKSTGGILSVQESLDKVLNWIKENKVETL